MVSSYFTYNKPKVIQALRYHFISRTEIKVLMIFVNVFAILSAALFYFNKISPVAFLLSSLFWFILMVVFWFLLPQIIYRRAATFKDSFRAVLSADDFTIENDRGKRGWEWTSFSTWMESPHFFHLYFNARSFFIVPKEAFEGEGVHEARKIFTNKIKR